MPDSLPILDTTETVKVTRVAGYVVVSEWRSLTSGAMDTSYDHCATLNDAADTYCEYERGEYPRARPVGIFPCDERGMPIDKPLDPHTLTKLVRETRAA